MAHAWSGLRLSARRKVHEGSDRRRAASLISYSLTSACDESQTGLSLADLSRRLVTRRRFGSKRPRVRVLAGFAVTGLWLRERLAAPVAETRDVQTESSGAHP
jgi:hypothetical protein